MGTKKCPICKEKISEQLFNKIKILIGLSDKRLFDFEWEYYFYGICPFCSYKTPDI